MLLLYLPAWIDRGENPEEKKQWGMKEQKKPSCLSPGSNWGPLVCETNGITNYTTPTL